MKSSNVLITVLIVIIVAGGLWWYFSQQAAETAMQNAATTTTPATANTGSTANSNPAVTIPVTVTTTSTTTVTTTPPAQHFTVNGNDTSADLTSISVPKGTQVTITFGADAGTTYHGGLDFRSSVVSTGTIAPGATKSVSFTAEQSFAFTPYWPATNIAKPYKIQVNVQ